MSLDEAARFVIERYNRNSQWYDMMDRMVSEEWRRKVTSRAVGKVLEVGVGTGKNLPLYDPAVTTDLVAIDFSPGMLSRARTKRCAVPLRLLTMDAQSMTFPDHSFDSVVATCVFCTVPDPVAGLREVKRVCKPNGRVLLLEHVRSEKRLMGWAMDVLDPLVFRTIGTHINRRTLDNVVAAGLQVDTVTDLKNGIVKLIEARP